jgi:hypothetical protein
MPRGGLGGGAGSDPRRGSTGGAGVHIGAGGGIMTGGGGRPRSVNSSFDSGRGNSGQLLQASAAAAGATSHHHRGGLMSTNSSIDHTGYLSDRNEVGGYHEQQQQQRIMVNGGVGYNMAAGNNRHMR